VHSKVSLKEHMVRTYPAHPRRGFGGKTGEFLAATLLLCGLAGVAWPRTSHPSPVFSRVESYIQQRQFDRAIALLQGILKKSPSDPAAHNLMGIALTSSGRPGEGNAHFHAALKSDPGFFPALKNLGLNELAMNRPEEARDHLERYLKYEPQDPIAHLSLGEIHYAKQEFGPAVDEYLKSGGLFARDPRMALRFARSCIESNQGERAVAALEHLSPEADSQAHFQAGLMLAQLEKYASAARQFELAKKDYPDPYEVGFNLTLAYVRSLNYPAAIQAAQDVIAKGYRKSELYNLLAEAYERNDQTIQAYNALRTATQIDPKDENNYLDLMALGVDHANFDLALDIADIGLRNIPDSYRLIMQRGAVKAFHGQITPAVEDFEEAAKMEPTKDLPYFGMCMALMQKDQTAQAIQIARQRLKVSPDDYLLLFALGEILSRSAASVGHDEEAVQLLERSVRLNPDFSTARLELGKLYLRQGEDERARVELERALQLDPADLTPCYQLAQIYRREGDKKQADELFAKFKRFRDGDRERHINRNLLKLLRDGEK
jgi:tetratricopeptide (TPR) repeat protein